MDTKISKLQQYLYRILPTITRFLGEVLSFLLRIGKTIITETWREIRGE